jgi:predicted ATP-grasp superfamily ATP-dependent carboligase
MVRTVAQSYDKIAKLYRINWPPPHLVLDLLDKKNLESRVKEKGLLYPKTFILYHSHELGNLRWQIQYPVIIKPAKPLSPFKAAIVNEYDELQKHIELYQNDVTGFLIQEWIPGTENNLYFASLYFDSEHRPIASFVGRKIRSSPPLTGVTTSAEPCDRPDILDAALTFFEDLPIRGPASLEIKEDGTQCLYVIEPTIGRFDYWILCCIVNGIDMPYISYRYQADRSVPDTSGNGKHTIWVDFERDLPVYVEFLRSKNNWREGLAFLFRRKVYALWAWDDVRPSVYAWPLGLKIYFLKFIRFATKLFRKPT